MRRIISLAIIVWLIISAVPGPVYGRDGDDLVQVWGETEEVQEVPPEEAEAEPNPNEPAGPLDGKGNPFVGITAADTGYCPAVNPYDGFGWDGYLVWPTDGRAIADGRHFKVTHTGIDIDSPVGSEVWAAEDGLVVFAGWSTWGFGNLVVIAHGGGWLTLYAHLDSVSVVCGQSVLPGEMLGRSGQTGQATWPHLHFEIRNGLQSYNPLLFLNGSW